jgi:hypothetical protein
MMISIGQIITFWSYRGSVGCSMALANVAWILAANGRRVLAIDWDLEAPGLQRYFHPFLDAHYTSHLGLMDMLWEHMEAPPDGSTTLPRVRGLANPENQKLSKFTVRLNGQFPAGGYLDLMPAGKTESSDYFLRLMRFSWQEFYDQFSGGYFLESLRNQLITDYDYVLIDGRTGISDIAGICTIQMPDILAACFTLNDLPSAEGLAHVCKSVTAYRQEREIRIFPIPTKIDPSGKGKVDSARERIKALFTSFLNHFTDAEMTQYWRDVEVPYDPYYSYEEVLSTFGDAPGRPHSMLASMEHICERLTCGRISRLPPVAKNKRKEVCSAFGSPLNDERQVFVSYVREDALLVQKLVTALRQAGIEVWIDKDSIEPGTRWQQAIRKAIRQGDYFIACFSKNYTSRNRNYMNEELVLAIEELRRRADRAWFIPVLLSECEVPDRSIGGGETLTDIQQVGLYEDWDAGIKRILRVVADSKDEIAN